MRWRKTCYAESPWLPERSLTAWLRVSPCRASAILVRARSRQYSCSVSAILVRARSRHYLCVFGSFSAVLVLGFSVSEPRQYS